MKSMKKRKKRIFQLKMNLAEGRESPEWTMENLDEALSNLKNNKSRDYEGLINELFKKS